MHCHTPLKATLLVLLLSSPLTVLAQYHDSTSMEIMTGNSYARDCYRAASIAARIHYTSSKEIETCTFALDYSALSLRDRAATLANRGIIYMALEDYQRAIQDYTAALNLKPEFGEINVNIGNVYYLGKVFDKAVEEYTAAIEKKTTKAHIAFLNRGMAYENLGDFDKAETDYRSSAQLVPDWALPEVRLDQLLRKKQEAEGEMAKEGSAAAS